jgi:glutamate/tyrosine decarboxylase-like PLP-dependent enzyme
MNTTPSTNPFPGFPVEGTDWETLRAELRALKDRDFSWRAGRLPTYTYFFNDDVLDVQRKAYLEYIVENGLANDKVLKSVPALLADIYAMAGPLFHVPEGSGASFTSGGTESVFMAVKTARDKARIERGHTAGRFSIVAPYSAHPCLNKAAHLLDLEVRRVPVGAEYRSDVEAMADAIDDSTIMLYSSAACYPYGVFDRIPELGRLARERELWLHVDACWSGFLSPFAKVLGYPIPQWDLSVDGVTSLSADIHKFGYGAKGASLVFYRDAADQEYEKFEFSGWPRGTYSTPTFTGSKPAGSIASAWAVMRYLGIEGYLRATGETFEATMRLIAGIDKIDCLECLQPVGESNLFAFVSTDPDVDIMAVADRLEERGWFRGRMREPLAIQQGVNPAHLPVVDEYLDEVESAVNYVRQQRVRADYDERSY